jgi:hypothetical protein
MMNKIDLIIDALERANELWLTEPMGEKALAAAHELKALAKPEQEPVAWVEHEWSGTGVTHLHFDRRKPTLRDEVLNPVWTPLYTAPPRKEWVSLSDAEEIELDEKYGDDFNAYIDARDAKLKEKNI